MKYCNWNCEWTQQLCKKGWLQGFVSKKHSTVKNARLLLVGKLLPQIMTEPLKYMAASAPLK